MPLKKQWNNYLLLDSFSHQRQLVVFHWSLSDNKSLQVSRTLVSILGVLNNVVVWMVSTRPRISKAPSLFYNPLRIVPKAPIMSGIIVTFLFHRFFKNSLVRSRYLSFFHFLSILVYGQPVQQSPQFCKSSFFFVDYLVFGPRLRVLYSCNTSICIHIQI